MNRNYFSRQSECFSPGVLQMCRHTLKNDFPKTTITTERDALAASSGTGTDGLRFNPLWYEPWRSASLTIREILISPGFQFVNYPPQVRWVRTESHLVPWHQDKAYVSHLGEVITCFVPIEDDPWRHSTIEFGDFLGKEQFQYVNSVAYPGPSFNEIPYRSIYYNLNLGDCLLFGDLVPHRAFVPRGAILERTSLEYRLSHKDKLIKGKDYFDLVTREMIKA